MRLRGFIGKGWVPLGSALVPESLPENVVGRYGVDAIRREPGEQITPHANLRHAAGPSSHANNTDAD